MRLTCCTDDDRVCEIDVGAESTFEDIKSILAAEFQVEPGRLVVSYKGDTSIPDRESVGNQGIADNDMLMVTIKREVAMPPPPRGNAVGGISDEMISRAFGGLLRPNARQMENQRNRQRMIDENFELAMNEHPESFGSVYMLYVDVEVNGVPVKAFIDSGAQTTVMSQECAQRTGVIGLVDPRFSGVATGVGAAQIMGKIHLVPVKLGDTFYNCSFSVLTAVHNLDILIGLDMLKRYECMIDLKNDCLRIGTTNKVVQFLPENEIPEHARLHYQQALGRAPRR